MDENNILLLGDCVEKMKGLPGGTVDMVLCDPPYLATRNKWDVAIPLDRLWPEIRRVCKDTAVIAIHSGGAYTAKLIPHRCDTCMFGARTVKGKDGNIVCTCPGGIACIYYQGEDAATEWRESKWRPAFECETTESYRVNWRPR